MIVLPNNKNIVPVAEQVARARPTRRVEVVPTHAVRRGARRARRVRPARADVDANAAAMTEAAQRVRTGEVTQAVRDSVGRVRADQAAATGSRSAATASSRGRQDRGRRRDRAASTSSSTTTASSSPCSSAPTPTPADTAAARGAPRARAPAASRSRSTRATSRCTRTSSASSSARGSAGRGLHACASSPRTRSPSCRPSAPSSRRRSPRWGSAPCSTCSSTTRAGTTTARSRPRSPSSTIGEEATVVRRGQARCRGRRTAPAARRWSRPRSTTARRCLQRRVLQPAVAREAAAGGHRGRVLRQGRRYRGKRQMTNPIVDVLGRAGDDEDRRDRARVPAVGQGRRATRGSSASSVADVLADGRAARLRRSARRPSSSPTASSSTATRAYRGIHRPESTTSRPARRGSGSRSTSSSACRSGSSRASARSRRSRRGSGTRSTARSSSAFHARAAVRAHRRPAARRSTRSRATSPRPAPMHRLLQGEVGSGKTRRRAHRAAHRGAGRLPGRAHGADRGARRAALPHGRARCSSELTVPSRGRRCSASGRCASSCSRTAPAPPTAAASPTGCATGEVDIVVGTHALIYGERRVRPPRRRGDRRAAPLRRRAARRCCRGKGDEPDVLVMTATPIPRTAAMLVYGDLDKSELREMPPGPDADRRPRWSARARSSGRAAYERLRDRGRGRPAGVRRVPARRGLGRSSRRRPPPRSSSDSRDEELAGLRLGLLHGQMPSAEKEAVMAAFRAGDARRARRDDRDRGRRRRAQRDGDDRRGRRPLRALAAAPAARPHRARRRRVVVLPVRRPDDPRRRRRAWRRWRDRPTASSSPSATSRSAAPGEVFGERQAGLSDLKLGRLPRDEPIVLEARAVAEQILDADPDLAAHAQLREEVEDLLGDASSSSSRADRVDRRWRDRDGARDGRAAGDRRRCRRPGARRAEGRTDAADHRPGARSRCSARSGPDRLVDASVLDLYAGSGALAIEALSRGAARAVLVDRDRAAVDRDPPQPRDHRASRAGPRRAGEHRRRVPGRAAARRAARSTSCSSTRPTPPTSAELGRGPERPRPAPGWLAAGATVVVERPVGRRAGAGPRGVEGHVGTGLRRYARDRPHNVDGLRDLTEQGSHGRGHRPLPGLVRPGDQRSPRHHRAHGASLRRRHRGRDPQPAEVAVAVHARGAPGDAARGHRAPRQRPHRVLQGPARRLRQGARRRRRS